MSAAQAAEDPDGAPTATLPPRPAGAGRAVEQGHVLVRRMHLALCSPLVDDALFRAALGGPRSDLNCVMRFLGMPVALRPGLSHWFDRLFYSATNLDVLDTGDDPFLHFVEHGLRQHRAPHPLVDLRYIAAHNPHVLDGPHAMEGLCDLLELDLARPSPYFDPAWYRQQLGAAAPDNGLLLHYLRHGLPRGAAPNPYLDLVWYAEQHADVAKEGPGALRHLVALGDRQGRATSARFDGAQYVRRYRDLEQSDLPPLSHFLQHGIAEGRQPVPHRPAAERGHAAAAVDPEGPIDPARSRQVYTAMRQRLREAMEARCPPVPPPFLHRSAAPAADLARIRLPPAPVPRLSVLIPVFNEIRHTAECLMALAASLPRGAGGGRGGRRRVHGRGRRRRWPASRTCGWCGRPATGGFINNCNAAGAAVPGALCAAAEQRHPGAAGSARAHGGRAGRHAGRGRGGTEAGLPGRAAAGSRVLPAYGRAERDGGAERRPVRRRVRL